MAYSKSCKRRVSGISGFTLVELLVVIAIIGVLSTLAIVALGGARQKARDSKRVADLIQIGKALELYFSDNGSYPTIITPGQPLVSPSDGATYLAKIPQNPAPRTDNGAPDTEYAYSAPVSGSGYTLNGWVGSFSGSSTPKLLFVSSAGGGGIVPCGQMTVLDLDGNSYGTVQIGTQCWLAQDLRTKLKPDGTCIIGGSAPCADASPSDSGLARSCRGASNIESNCAIYGASYTWAGAMNGSTTAGVQGICPAGWHVPTHDEITTLERAVCTSATCETDFPYNTSTSGYRGTNEATKLKSTGTSGFNGILYTGAVTYWTSVSSGGSSAWYRTLTNLATPFRSTDQRTTPYQVRCLKN